MSTPTYEQLMDFYYDFLANQQERERDEWDVIELLGSLLEGYQLLDIAENIVELRRTINRQNSMMTKAGLIRQSSPPFLDLYSDIQEDFSHYRAYQKYASYLKDSDTTEVGAKTHGSSSK